jgi:UDP-N-acetylmuramate dehydrogenase
MGAVIKMNIEREKLRGELRHHEPMSRHTSWRVGGAAKNFYLPADVDDLAYFIELLPVDEKIYWVGLGSNLLVRDGGFDGTIICTSAVLKILKLEAGNRVYVEAGVACPKVARFAAKQGLKGSEFLCGIPGTMGGALAMNAGAFGGETWDVVENVRTIDRAGILHERLPSEYEIGYRHVTGTADEWFVSCVLHLSQDDSQQGLDKIKQLLSKRGASQPTQQPNAGSVFRNPEGDYAARLIEGCGLKGLCIGGACISDKHANFIINTGTATAGDIECLINKVQTVVHEETGVVLQTEVKVVGNES